MALKALTKFTNNIKKVTPRDVEVVGNVQTKALMIFENKGHMGNRRYLLVNLEDPSEKIIMIEHRCGCYFDNQKTGKPYKYLGSLNQYFVKLAGSKKISVADALKYRDIITAAPHTQPSQMRAFADDTTTGTPKERGMSNFAD